MQNPLDAPAFDTLKLHSAFRDGQFLLWGQVEAQKQASRRLPFGAKPARIRRAISQVTRDAELALNALNARIWIPDDKGRKLEPWGVATIALSAQDTFYFLDACNRNPVAEDRDNKIAPSTRFWAAALKFVAGLAVRDRFVPSIAREGLGFHARWKPLISAPDQEKLRELARAMPPIARAITAPDAEAPPEDDPTALLTAFVTWIMDTFPREASSSTRLPMSVLKDVNKKNMELAWTIRLRSGESELPGDEDLLTAFAAKVERWQRPLVREAALPWVLAFELREPDESEEAWRVAYGLESVDGGPPPEVDAASTRYAARLLARAATICTDIREDSDSFPLDVTGAFRFLTQTANDLEQQGFRVAVPEWWKRRALSTGVRARPVIKSAAGNTAGMFSLGELMQFDWEVAIGGERYTHEELDKLAESTAPLVKVHGKWIPFDPQSIRSALDLWKTEPAPAREVIRMALGSGNIPSGVQLEEARGEGWIGELLGKLSGHTRFEELETPVGFQGTLRPYQVRGFSWLGFLKQYGLGACLADDMGLGKTIQALALLERERANGSNRPALLICPTSVVGNWRKEAAKFAPQLPVMIHHGMTRARGQEFAEEASRHALVISSYALTHRDLEQLREVPWSGIILDEAQNIKNPETRQSRAVRSLNADYRIALTGTPVENNVGDLWSIMDFLNPGLLGNQADFRRQFLVPIQKRADSEAALELRKLTAPFILRRLKSDSAVVQDLPEKMEMKVYCNLTPEQASLYRSVVDETTRAIDMFSGIQRKGAILAALTKLKQVCNHPAHFLGDQSPLAERSGKLMRLTEMVEELLSEGDRALIFSQFTGMGERLQKHLKETFGEEVLFLHGGVPAHKRDEMVERFQSGEPGSPRLFVLSLKAGGTGLNLTAANHVFHFDRWWNPAVENQATDRAFRIGQKRNVQIHKFVCVGTLEERIDEMIERKKAVAEHVIGTGEAWLTELSTSEIKSLFALRQEALL